MKGSNESLYLPRPATIREMRKLTERETLFKITPDDRRPLGHKPGQFVQISLLGIGEAPFGVSSSPTRKDYFEIVVRAVGNVTKALHKLSKGDRVWVRGPFGKGFDTEFLKGKDLMFISGGLGIVPLRSLINYVFDNRKDFGRLMILYGCKEPCELLFSEEVAEWDKQNGTERLLTVDVCPEGACWEGNIGLITMLIPKVKFDPNKTHAVVVGPPIMYRFVIKELKNKGMPDENIIVSLERRMKCGVGKCGHCQINNVYVCQEGPVFKYSEIRNLQEAL